MKKYSGTEQVKAKPMTRGEYNVYRGWTIPEHEKKSDEGYLIERDGGHLTWLPKSVFEKAFFEVEDHIEMIELKHDLLTTKYTGVFHEKEFQFNSPHYFQVHSLIGDKEQNTLERNSLVGEIHFQEGPIKEVGVNGVCNEDLIAIVICHLEHFQQSDYRCRENAMAITKLEEAMLWLRKRTMGRENRGIEGTHSV